VKRDPESRNPAILCHSLALCRADNLKVTRAGWLGNPEIFNRQKALSGDGLRFSLVAIVKKKDMIPIPARLLYSKA